MAVAEFLEKSPDNRVMSELTTALAKDVKGAAVVLLGAKEPDSVLGANRRFGKGGSWDLRASGKRVVTVSKGKLVAKNSEFLMTVAKFC